MCNPPFYISRDELVESAKQKKRPPFSVNELSPPAPLHAHHILHPCLIDKCVLTVR